MYNLSQSVPELLREESILEKLQTNLNLSSSTNTVTARLCEKLVAKSLEFKLKL